MTDELKQQFTKRITHANRTELIVILYDMFEQYAKEAEAGFTGAKKGDDASKESLEHASEVLKHLKNDLDFSQDEEFCKTLYSIYTYCQELLSKAVYSGDYETVKEARELIRPIRDSYAQISETDNSEPLMQNVPDTVAGYTYGKTDVNEAEIDPVSNRGFLV
ncbi:MAG: flagellar protein FliS [Lachnospiraceae bacterium]|nr:flagellar protein FliS [Lachnospiraceae bacterium]